MLLEEVRATKIDDYLLIHLVAGNIATGMDIEHTLEDFLYSYDNTTQLLGYRQWLTKAEYDMRAFFINNKVMALQKIILKIKTSDDINEKRGYLLDAMKIERQINEILYGEDEE